MITHIHAQRVIIGRLSDLSAIDPGRFFLIASRRESRIEGLGEVARWDRPVVHTPVEVTAEALQALKRANAESIVAIGGGSAIGLAKALAARTGLPQIAVPTTYAGSEVTPVLGETADGVKTTRRDPALLPGTVVYDPELTMSMPRGLTLTSALNALAHAVEAGWAPDATAYSDALAAGARAGILGALPGVLNKSPEAAERGRLQQAAWLAGLCLAQTRMGLHHQLAHALGGTFNLPHAELHTMLLPHVMAFNTPQDPDLSTIRALAASHDGPRTLRELGVPRDGLPAIAERVVAAPYPNPRPLVLGEIGELLDRVWSP